MNKQLKVMKNKKLFPAILLYPKIYHENGVLVELLRVAVY